MKNIKKITAILLCAIFAVCGINFTGAAAIPKYCVTGSFTTQSGQNQQSNKPVKVTFVEQSGVRIAANVEDNGKLGTYNAEVEPGVYDIVIEKPGYLTYRISGVRVNNRDIVIPQLGILPGDLNSDGVIDTKDLAVFMRGFSEKQEYAELRKLADFDEDGNLNVTDFGNFKLSFEAAKNSKNTDNYEWTNIMKLQTDYRYNPVGIDYTEPEFNWVMESTKRGEKQTAYRLGVATTYENAVAGNFDVWDSGKVESDSTHAYYGKINGADAKTAAVLAPKTRYYWTVSSWNVDEREIPSAEIAYFETALFGDFGNDNKWIEAQEQYIKNAGGIIEVDLTVTQGAFGINFCNSKDNERRYMWQIALTTTDTPQLRPHYYDGGWKEIAKESKDLSEIFPSGQDAIGQNIKMKLVVGNGIIKTYINDVFVSDYNLKESETPALGCVYGHTSSGETGVINGVTYYDSDGNYLADGGNVPELAASLFRKQFTLSQSLENVEKARLYATAAGNHIMYMNGKRAGNDYMAPGKSKYTEVLYYQTYDVKDKLLDGDNTVGAEVGHGWYNAGAVSASYGTNVALKAKLIITYNDGTEQVVDTDSTWEGTRDGRTTTDKYYIGQYVDGRKIIDGWCENNNDSAKWTDVSATDKFKSKQGYEMTDNFVAENMEPVRHLTSFYPTSVQNPKENVFVYKFDQNLVGTSRITAKAPAGTEIVVQYSEFLSGDGGTTINDSSYNGHNGTDKYIFRGDENGETVEFDFVYHGFQYIQITGLSEALPFENIEGMVLTSDMELTGNLETSNEKINRYIENVLWSIRGNFVSTLTDCPTREKNTWTGDAQIFAAVSSYYANVFNHYRNFQDMTRQTQFADGAIPELIPSQSKTPAADGNQTKAPSGWSDCIVIIPWEMYNQYGDITILEDNYEAMKKWVDFIVTKKVYDESRDGELDTEQYYYIKDSTDVRLDGNYGDHLAAKNYGTGVGYYCNEYRTTQWVWRETSYPEMGTAFSAYSCKIITEVAKTLGKTEDIEYYENLHDRFAKAWRTNFVAEDGITCLSGGTSTKNAQGVYEYTPGNGSQTSYAMGIYFDLYETEEKKRAAAEKLAEIVKNDGYVQTVGFIGMNIIYPALGWNNQFDTAMSMIENESYPSLLYMVNNGATTIWETYAGGTMSRNHYVFGAPARWLYTDVLGIGHNYIDGNAGYKHFELRPNYSSNPDTSVTWAKGSYDSMNGLIKSEWKLADDRSTFTYNCTVPSNTTATLKLPVENENALVTESGKKISEVQGVKYVKTEDGKKVYELESGVYEFVVYNNIDDEESPKKADLTVLKNANVVCIGDSLTQGDYGSEVSNVANVKEKGYPYFFAQNTGANVMNAGVCGYTPELYWKNKIKSVSLSSNTNIVLIMLGTNGGLTNTVESDTNAESYENYAETQTGYYARIIEYVKEKTKGQAMIVLMTPPVAKESQRSKAHLEGVVTAVNSLAKKYGLNVIDNYNCCGITYDNYETYLPIDGLHCGEAGYELLATYIAEQTAICYDNFQPEEIDISELDPQAYMINGTKTVFAETDDGIVTYGGKSYRAFDHMTDAFAALGNNGGRVIICGTFDEQTDPVKDDNTAFTDVAGRGKVTIDGIDENAVWKYNHTIKFLGDTKFGNIKLNQTYGGSKYLITYGNTEFSSDCEIEGSIYIRNGSVTGPSNYLTLNGGRFTQMNVCGNTTLGTSEKPQTAQLVVNDGATLACSINAGYSNSTLDVNGNINIIINGGTFTNKSVTYSKISNISGKSTVIFNNGTATGFSVDSNIDYVVKSAAGGTVSVKTEATPSSAPTFLFVPKDSKKVPYIGAVALEKIGGEYIYTPEISDSTVEISVNWFEKDDEDYSLSYAELSAEEKYGYVGRWFDSVVTVGEQIVNCKGTITAGSELYFAVENTSNVWLRVHSTSSQNAVIAVSVDNAAPVRIDTVKDGDVLIAQGLSKEKHTVRVIVDGLYEYMGEKWIYGYGFNFECAVVDNNGTISGITPSNPKILYFGDSITEGVFALNTEAKSQSNSQINAYPFQTSRLLGAVSYTCGYGASGVTRGGSGSVPKCLTVIDYILEDKEFSIPTPNAIIINHGHNDGGVTSETFISEYNAVIDRLREKFPTTPILCVVPYNQSHSADIKTCVGERSNVYYISTSGWSYTKTDGAHPDSDGAKSLGRQLSEAVKNVLGEDYFKN